MTERLTDKTKDGKWYVCGINEASIMRLRGYGRIIVGLAIDKLAEYETAEEEGRLVVLPCKPGQDLFGIYNGAIVDGYADGYLMEKTSVYSDSEHWIWFQDKYSRDFWKVSFDDFGRTIFLTREKAEKALEEMKKQE